jgi:hypothetical protein
MPGVEASTLECDVRRSEYTLQFSIATRFSASRSSSFFRHKTFFLVGMSFFTDVGICRHINILASKKLPIKGGHSLPH